MSNAPLLQVRDIHKTFGALEVLKGVDLDVERGQAIAILGASGSGKSTLLRCINLLELPTRGTIALSGDIVGSKSKGGGQDYSARDLVKVRKRIGMVFQQFNLFPHRTALENVIEGPVTVKGMPRREAEDLGRSLLAKVGLADKATTYPARLSGGQQQRVAIARALAMEPEIMLFDEATSALDPELVGEVLRTIRQLADEGMTMLIVTHELGFAYHVADTVVFLHQGRVLEQGPPEEVLVRPRESRTQEFLDGHGQFRLPERAP
jgi:polar amino acid transport system ATP-binding protein